MCLLARMCRLCFVRQSVAHVGLCGGLSWQPPLVSCHALPGPFPSSALWDFVKHDMLIWAPQTLLEPAPKKNTKDGFIKIPRKAPAFLFKPLYRGNLASQLQTSKPCPALQASESFFFVLEVECSLSFWRSNHCLFASVQILWIKACRVYFKGAVFRGDVDCDHLEQDLYLCNHIQLFTTMSCHVTQSANQIVFHSASLPQRMKWVRKNPHREDRKTPKRREKCGGRNPSVMDTIATNTEVSETLTLECTDPLSRGVWSSCLRPHPSHTPAHPGKTTPHPSHSPKSCYITFEKHVWWNSGGYPDPPPTLVGQTIMSFILPPAPLPSFLAHYIKPHSIMLHTSLPQTQVQWIPHTFVLLWNSSFTHRQSLNCLCTFSTEVRLSFYHLFCYSTFILYDLNTDESHIVFFIIGGNLLLQFQVKHERLFGFGPLRGRSHCMDDDRR